MISRGRLALVVAMGLFGAMLSVTDYTPLPWWVAGWLCGGMTYGAMLLPWEEDESD